MTLDDLVAPILAFRDDRDWGRFHTPKNLALAIAGEAGELAQLYRWCDQADRTKTAEEIADVFIFLVTMADAVGIDLPGAVTRKLAMNALKYPVKEVLR